MNAKAVRRAALLRYAAFQFIVLVIVAMVVYAGGAYWDPAAPHYAVSRNFLSDLGLTHAWSGRANYASAVVFFVALTSLGVALVAFSWSWREFAFARGRARFAGRASAVLGTASGIAFAGVACTPFDLALVPHLVFVIAAFGLLLGYVVALAIVMARNGAARAQTAANVGYIALVLAYVALILCGPRLETEHGFRIQVIGQKLIALGSMLHVIYLTSSLRRHARAAASG